jgi:hypothetical protein
MHLCGKVSRLSTYTSALTDLPTSLDRTRSGIDLTEAVRSLFSRTGPCWVKVRFDRKNIPAAFVQFQVSATSDHR